jgi:hypothetical protein
LSSVLYAVFHASFVIAFNPTRHFSYSSGSRSSMYLLTLSYPDGLIHIIAARVNDIQSPEQETVTLLNRSNREISLNGWKIADKQKNKMPLDGTVGPGAAKTITVTAPVSLSNKGGIITLLNDNGLKVDGVSYTRSKTRHPGWTLTF